MVAIVPNRHVQLGFLADTCAHYIGAADASRYVPAPPRFEHAQLAGATVTTVKPFALTPCRAGPHIFVLALNGSSTQ